MAMVRSMLRFRNMTGLPESQFRYQKIHFFFEGAKFDSAAQARNQVLLNPLLAILSETSFIELEFRNTMPFGMILNCGRRLQRTEGLGTCTCNATVWKRKKAGWHGAAPNDIVTGFIVHNCSINF